MQLHQVLPPLQLAPLGGKAPLPPLNKPSLQPLQPTVAQQAGSSAGMGSLSSASQPGSSLAALQGMLLTGFQHHYH